ncbi:unannotated protein [freshwater metagenome]|jgi:probable rRNA maturation factor|uniref:Unannotated protein n=1 Tax=freshwater metagenome TaxID=449393 RepID=A0A6J7DIZ5_9ZZZZ|nr:rRNA maturation RNase YbeY [Actinomycetota bacterium]
MPIELTNESSHTVDEQRLINVAQAAMNAMFIDPASELSISVVNDEVMEKLHVEWMDEPGPTDVLSFPMDELLPGKAGQPLVSGMLGDIVIAPQFTAQQASAAGRAFEDELDLLMVHGVLHLLGFDHQEPDEHAVMFALQDEILANFRSEAGTA